MTDNGPAIRRLCVAAAGHPDDELDELLARVCVTTRLDRLLWNDLACLPRTGVLPPGIDEPQVVTDLVLATWAAVRCHNHHARERLAVRLALDEGLTMLVHGEFDGPGIATTRTLCEEARSPAPLTVAVSPRLFDDLHAAPGHHLPLHRFLRTPTGSHLALFDEC